MSAITDAFPPLAGAVEGDQLYLRVQPRDTTAELQLRLRRDQQVLVGDLHGGAWHLVQSDLGPRGLEGFVHWATVCRRADGSLFLRLTGAPLFPVHAAPELATAARCKGCQAPITWLRSAKGTAIPVNRSEHAPEPYGVFDPQLHTSHFATCPKAAQYQRRPARDAAERATPQDRAEVQAFQRLLQPQPQREQGWPERVRALRDPGEALGLVKELGERVPSASTRLAVQDQLVLHLVQGARAILQRANAEGLRQLGELLPLLEPGPAATLAQGIGARQLELDPAELTAEVDRWFGGEERLDG